MFKVYVRVTEGSVVYEFKGDEAEITCCILAYLEGAFEKLGPISSARLRDVEEEKGEVKHWREVGVERKSVTKDEEKDEYDEAAKDEEEKEEKVRMEKKKKEGG